MGKGQGTRVWEKECDKGMELYETSIVDKASSKGMGYGTGACGKGLGHEIRAWTRAWHKGMGKGQRYVACACGKGMWQGHVARAWGRRMGKGHGA